MYLTDIQDGVTLFFKKILNWKFCLLVAHNNKAYDFWKEVKKNLVNGCFVARKWSGQLRRLWDSNPAI